MVHRSSILFIAFLSFSLPALGSVSGCGDTEEYKFGAGQRGSEAAVVAGSPSSQTAPSEQGASAPWHLSSMTNEERLEAVRNRYAERVAQNPHGRLSGQVARPDGEPIAHVKVYATPMGQPEGATRPRSMETSTDESGQFALDAVDIGPMVVSFEHDKYVFKQEIDVVNSGEAHELGVTLLPRGEPRQFDVGKGATIRNGFVTVHFPPSVLVFKDDQTPVQGEVEVTVTPIDPRKMDDIIAAPARLEGITVEGRPTTLMSYGMIEVEMSQGERKLEVKGGATVRVDFSVDGMMNAQAGAKIPMWHHDRSTGYWVQQSGTDASVTAGPDGRLIASAELPHFSSWNVDSISDSICSTFVLRRLTPQDPNTSFIPSSVRIVGTDANGNCNADVNGSCTIWTIIPHMRALDSNGKAFTFNAPTGANGKGQYFKIVGKKQGVQASEALLVRFPNTESQVVSGMMLNNYLIQGSGQSSNGSAVVGNWCGPLPAGWSFPKAQYFNELTIQGDQIQYFTPGTVFNKPMSQWRMPFTYAFRMPGTTFTEGAAQNASNNAINNPSPADADSDGVIDVNDNCPQRPNPFQYDSNNNGIGDACEVYCYVDPNAQNASFYDSDGDAIDDWCDNNPSVSNPTQLDNVVYDL